MRRYYTGGMLQACDRGVITYCYRNNTVLLEGGSECQIRLSQQVMGDETTPDNQAKPVALAEDSEADITLA